MPLQKFEKLSKQARSDPKRATRVDAYKRAMRALLKAHRAAR